MQRIYEPENLMEGEMLVGMLASEGIEVHLVGRDCWAVWASCRCRACWGWRWPMSRPNTPGS
jgi:hypothetical protein